VIILIPSYEPDHKLVTLVESIVGAEGGHHVLVVNDGSDPRFDPVFERLRFAGATVIEHEPNRGKGYALKQGFAYVTDNFADHDVVCADSDGQHTLSDILAVAAAVRSHGAGIVLGARDFIGEILLRSRLRNSATRIALSGASGPRHQDTQTGLRGYPALLLGWLMTVDGDRFDYELPCCSRRNGGRSRWSRCPSPRSTSMTTNRHTSARWSIRSGCIWHSCGSACRLLRPRRSTSSRS